MEFAFHFATHTHTHTDTFMCIETLTISLNTLAQNALFRYVYIYVYTYVVCMYSYYYFWSSYVFTKINSMESSLETRGEHARQGRQGSLPTWTRIVEVIKIGFYLIFIWQRFSLKIFLGYIFCPSCSAKVRHCPQMRRTPVYVCVWAYVNLLYMAAYGNSFTLTYLSIVYLNL